MKEHSWIIRGGLCCDKGSIRKNNEDSFYFNGEYMPSDMMDVGATLATTVPAKGTLWAVCDGMGGEENGEIASFTAANNMNALRNQLQNRDFAIVLQRWIREVSIDISEKTAGGGSTLAMLYCEGETLQIAHVGDSRVYRLRDGMLEQTTRDHSKVELLLSAGMITQDEAKKHPQKNVITRYLGMDEEYVCEATISPKLQMMNGDRYLLCSDGVTDMLTDADILNCLSCSDDALECANKIKEDVIATGARDNFTAMIIDVELEDDDPQIEEDDHSYDEDDDEPTIDDGKRSKIAINISLNNLDLQDAIVNVKMPTLRNQVRFCVRSIGL